MKNAFYFILKALFILEIFNFVLIFGLATARSYKIGTVGNNWLVGNAVFSKTALRIFQIFCIKLGDYKGRKVTARFLKKILDLEIFAKTSPNYPKIRHFNIWLVGWLLTQFS